MDQNQSRRAFLKRTAALGAAGAAAPFFRRLEQHTDRTLELVSTSYQHLGCHEQYGGVAVVPASMHLSGRAGGEIEPGVFFDGKSVHVGSEQYGRSWKSSLDVGSDPGAGNSGFGLKAQLSQEVGYYPGGAVLLESELGVLMEVSSEGHQLLLKLRDLRGWFRLSFC